MDAPCRAPAQLEDLLLDDDSASSSDADTYDESLDIASVAGTFFLPDSDAKDSDDNILDAAPLQSGDEAPNERAATTPKSHGEKWDRVVLEPALDQPRPIDDIHLIRKLSSSAIQ